MPSDTLTAPPFDPALLSRLLDLDEAAAPPPAGDSDPQAPFPLTELQRGYLLGRDPDLPLGGAACQFYYEIDCETLDIPRYRDAWARIVRRHPMLRAEILDATRQRVRDGIPDLAIPVHDWSAASESCAGRALAAVRRRLARDLPARGRWPLFDVELSLWPAGRARIHLRFDLLITDQQSILTILDEVARFYRDPGLDLPEPAVTFKQIVESRAADGDERARRYWRARAADLPDAPQLPMPCPLERLGRPVYERLSQRIEPAPWNRLKALAAELGVTPSCVLLGLFGEALAVWSETRHFCLNMTLFDRPPVHPDIDRVVGDFTTTLLFEMDLRLPMPRRERFARLQNALWRDIEHSAFGGVAVMREMARARGHLDRPLMPVVFTSTLSQNDARLFADAQAQPGRPVLSLSQTPQVILDNQVMEWEGALLVNWDVAVNALAPEVARDLFDRFTGLIGELADDPSRIDRASAAMPDPDAAMIEPPLVPPGPGDGDTRLADPWLRALPACGDRPAIRTADRTLTHAALARRVAGIADALRARGLGRGATAALLLEKSPDQIAACLAVSLLGAVYVPVDANQPAARQARILADLRPDLLLHKAPLPESLRGSCPSLDLDGTGEGDPAGLAALEGAGPRDPAYIIYTSGSTGQPKGVTVTHAAAVNTIRDVNRRFGIGADDCVLGLSELHFDLSVHDVFGVLGCGGALALPDPDQQRDPAHWHRLCAGAGVTLWNTVPGLFALLVDYHETGGAPPAPALRTVLLSGDWIPLDLPDRARRLWPAARFVGLGGATEAAIWSIAHPIDTVDPDWASIPYGRALGRQQVFVLDKALALCPPGKTGELFIAGDGLATGYHGDLEKTRRHFFPHPRSGLPLYRTGDLGRYRADGIIVFQGRADGQVKINGFRVETGEIARALKTHPAVEDAAILAVGDGRHPRLAAFVKSAAAPPPAPAAPAALRDHLAALLPSHMLPAHWSFVEAWPLTANGKLDRKALAARLPAQPAAATAAVPAARGDALERSVLDMVARVLDQPAVAMTDNLVALGATSLELIALANRIESQCGRRPALTELARAVAMPDLVALVRGLTASLPDAPIWPGERRLRDRLTRSRPIADPVARRLFKNGLARPVFPGASVALGGDGAPIAQADRRSWRRFRDGVLPLDSLGRLLGALRRHHADGEERFQYASAGGLYPVETYLLIPEGRVEGVAAGGYWYDPENHRLTACAPPAEPFPDLGRLSAGNRDWVGRGRFLIGFVVALDRIVPLYEGASLPFALIECGAMCQLLEQAAAGLPDAGLPDLGLCQLGDLAPEELSRLFALPPDRLYLHGLVGGLVDPQRAAAWRAAPKTHAPQDMTEGTL
ncbi:amino acid adenylation domain-containing protein [Azospirillum agricola]|uniref:non-ribosomal peptide synthetase n=1 Tax=Azospirillum agricola TaxID=1720247 RepID=UPI001AE4F568|nr:non-ribosomal peptide synthetase [Azospirillum agricola]MBP2231645.1 amino acid adenylation domain-containing protein [Azospirillum agricola]